MIGVRTAIYSGLLLFCVGAGAARADGVIGKVQVGPTGLANAVVSIEGAKGTAAPRRVVLDQHDKSFVPHVLALMKGGTVEFQNSDDFLHNTFSDSKTKVFNLNQPSKGSRSLLKVDAPGIIDVRCHIHGNMQAWIVVLDNPFFAVTDAKGLLKIDGVPPGDYKVKCWSEQYGVLTQNIKVTDKGGTVIFKYAAK